MAKQCAFCGADKPLTKEHVFPQWARDLPGVRTQIESLGGYNDSPAPLNVVRRGPQGIYEEVSELRSPRIPNLHEVQVKCVCSECNNGWMSQMEMSAARLVRILTSGQRTTLDNGDISVLASWSYKTFLMYDQWYPLEDRIFSPSELNRYYLQRVPPPEATIWIGLSASPAVQIALWSDWRMVGLPSMTVQEIRASGVNIGSAFLAVGGLYFILHYHTPEFPWTEPLRNHLHTRPTRRLNRDSLLLISPQTITRPHKWPVRATGLHRMERQRLLMHNAVNQLGRQDT